MRLPFVRHGAGGRAIVLLHGWFSSGPVWTPVLDALDAQGRSVVIPDLRGAGAARTFPGPYDEDTAVADLCELFDAAGLASAVVVGHSMSARIALVLAAEAPDRVESVVAVAPVPPQGLAFDRKAWSLYRAALDDDEAMARVIEGLSGRRYPRGWARGHAALARAAMSREAGEGYLDSYVTRDLSARVEGITRPVLGLCGAADPAMTGALAADSLAPLCRRLSVAELPACSHYPMLEAPLLLALSINAWARGAALPEELDPIPLPQGTRTQAGPAGRVPAGPFGSRKSGSAPA